MDLSEDEMMLWDKFMTKLLYICCSTVAVVCLSMIIGEVLNISYEHITKSLIIVLGILGTIFSIYFLIFIFYRLYKKIEEDREKSEDKKKSKKQIKYLENLLDYSKNKLIFPVNHEIASNYDVKYIKLLGNSITKKKIKFYTRELKERKIRRNSNAYKWAIEEINLMISDILILNSNIEYDETIFKDYYPEVLNNEEMEEYKKIFPNILKEEDFDEN